VWATLSSGATLVLPDETTRTSPSLLRDWIVANRITVAFVPTVLAELMIKSRWPADTALRLLLTGADTLHNFPRGDLPFEVVNNYGPTECTVVATSGVVRAQPDGLDLPSIGRPISATRIYLLDQAGNPVADGDSGEIYIAGPGVARGYRNRPELTAHRFLPDRFGGKHGGRMYRTGDRGRLLSDGQIMFQGRLDKQEKIRGHRVEPDEITSKLNQHAGIRASAVIGDGPERQRRLIAYIVQTDDARLTADHLRSFLAQSLPDYMIPAVFVTMAALPHTSNGKLDKRALPKPNAGNTLPMSTHREPATPTERRIAAIVSEVLGVEQVGVDDNFFLLGGHSLLGTQVVLQVREVFGIELTLRHLFTAPTVGRLAAAIETMIVQKVHAMSDEEAQRQADQLSLAG
jgi:acyl-coenzyme A synthetase/AMP-(fatty) acid ligase/acyl carrier protein